MESGINNDGCVGDPRLEWQGGLESKEGSGGECRWLHKIQTKMHQVKKKTKINQSFKIQIK
jgi:hypothetical protein